MRAATDMYVGWTGVRGVGRPHSDGDAKTRPPQVGHNIMLRQTISFRFPFPLKDSITKRVPYLSERPAPVANRPHSNSLMIEHLLLALALSSE